MSGKVVARWVVECGKSWREWLDAGDDDFELAKEEAEERRECLQFEETV